MVMLAVSGFGPSALPGVSSRGLSARDGLFPRTRGGGAVDARAFRLRDRPRVGAGRGALGGASGSPVRGGGAAARADGRGEALRGCVQGRLHPARSVAGWSPTHPSPSRIAQGNTCELRAHRMIDDMYCTVPQASLSRVVFVVVGRTCPRRRGTAFARLPRDGWLATSALAGRRQSCEWTVCFSTRVMDRLPCVP